MSGKWRVNLGKIRKKIGKYDQNPSYDKLKKLCMFKKASIKLDSVKYEPSCSLITNVSFTFVSFTFRLTSCSSLVWDNVSFKPVWPQAVCDRGWLLMSDFLAWTVLYCFLQIVFIKGQLLFTSLAICILFIFPKLYSNRTYIDLFAFCHFYFTKKSHDKV